MDSYTYGDQTYSIRNPKLDKQRSQLIKRILTIPENLSKDQVQQELLFVKKFCSSHFTYEEMEMFNDSYPKSKEHIQHHRELYKEISRFSNTLVDSMGSGRKLKRFLLNWFDDHTLNHDKKYLEFCQLRLVRDKEFLFNAS